MYAAIAVNNMRNKGNTVMESFTNGNGKAASTSKQDAADLTDDRKNIRKYFKQLRVRLLAGLIGIFFLPHALFTLYFHMQFTSGLKESGKLNLMALSESQGNTIDLFLQERVVNLFNLFHSREFNLKPSKSEMEYYLHNLRQVSDAFVDVGFLNKEGIQIGYAGPFPYLQGKDYRNEKWFKTLLSQDKGYFISDIYLGFRNKPHFTIATRQLIDGRSYIMRATLDPDKFYMFLRTIYHGKGGESALINENGRYQIVDPSEGKLLGKSDFMPSPSQKTGVNEIHRDGSPVIIAHTWLKETNWALLVRQPLNIVHASMYKTRKIMMASLVSFLLITGILILILTRKYIGYAQASAEKSQDLRSQLFHAAKMASVGELATGIAHEINNPLAIITSTSGVIKDMIDPEIDMDFSPENVLEEVDIIESAAFRAGKITRQLLDFGHKEQPSLVPCNVNTMLDEVIIGLKAREFKVENIEIIRDYAPHLPQTLLDPDQIRQVFLNILNNAGDAISSPGSITIITGVKGENISITIRDTGEGMTGDQITKIFDPFYTTKEVGKGTGLGLSVSLSIVESLGGSITVQSLKDEGSSFTILLPIKSSEIIG